MKRANYKLLVGALSLLLGVILSSFTPWGAKAREQGWALAAQLQLTKTESLPGCGLNARGGESETTVGTNPLREVVAEKLKTQRQVKLELFVMSQCPFGIRAEQAVAPLVREFGPRLDFSLNYIASESSRAGFSSLHGQPEVEENIRQLVMTRDYPNEYWDYLLARARDGQGPWQPLAAAAGMDAAAIERVAASAKGGALLRQNIRRANALGISASPTVYLDGLKYTGRILPAAAAACVPVACQTDADCNDNNNCTNDTCQSGVCQNQPLQCPGNQSCDPTDGKCKVCTSNAECNDSNPCTNDTCDVSTGRCEYTAINQCSQCTNNPTVTNTHDSGAGSLRQAIIDACAGSTITFADNVSGTLTLRHGELVIDKNLTIQGPGAQVLAVSGNCASSVFNIASGVTAILKGLTVANGNSNSRHSNDGNGGGIFNSGTLTVANSTLSGNSADTDGGGIYNEVGGTLTVSNSTLSGNYSEDGGGGLDNRGIVIVANSTLSGNYGEEGGGIYNEVGGMVNVKNTIIAGNTATDSSPDVFGSFTSQGHNLIGKSDGSGGFTHGNNGDQVGTSASPLNPLLGPLGNNGGPTQTHALLPGSPAINAGDNCVAQSLGCLAMPLTTDQRGFNRPVGGGVDIGAFEANYALTATGGTPQSTSVNTVFAALLQATLTENGLPVSGVPLVFTAPGSGASGTITSSNPVNTDANGQASLSFRANSVMGSYVVSANTMPPLPSPASFNLTNACQPLTIMPTSLAAGTVGQAYHQSLAATGAFAAAASFTVLSGALPNGLTLSPGGAVSGTPTQPGTFNFTVKATDTLGCLGTATISLLIHCQTYLIQPGTLSAAQAGVPYSQTLSTNSGNGAVTFSLLSGSLPGGITLSSAGLLSGTATALGNASFAVTATDGNGCPATQSYTLNVQCPAFTLSALPGATAGTAYSQSITVTPNLGGPHSFALTSGSLPPGLALAPTGVLSGTPAAAGTFTFTVTALGANGFSSCQGSRMYSLSVACPVMTLSPTSLPNGATGTAYSQSLSATPGGTVYSYAVTSGSLPTGLSLNSATGVMSGTPAAAGNFSFVITATGWANGAGNCTGSQAYNVLVTSNCAAITVNPPSLANGASGTAYNQTLSASGGPYSFAVTSGNLPAGVSLNAATGALTGTPTTSGIFSFAITATGAGGCTGMRSYSITISCPAITLSPEALPQAITGTSYNQMVTASPASPYSYSVVAGSLPPGLALNATTGAITGTATATGNYSFTLKATSAGNCSGTKAYSLSVTCPATAVNPASLPGGSAGTAYHQSLSATPAASYTFTKLGGMLPPGLTLAGDGTLSGTPTTSGSFSFTVKATAFATCQGTRTYTIVIGSGACPAISLPALPDGTAGVAYYGDLSGTAPFGSYAFTLDNGSLPPGLALDDLFAALFGTPAAGGTFHFTLQATRNDGCTGTRAYTLTISSSGVKAAVAGDFDGDGKSDLSVWRGELGTWLVLNSSTQQTSSTHWGAQSAPYHDTLAASDYDGDGKTDWAVYRRAEGAFYVKFSASGATQVAALGTGSEVPVPGDYDGDGQSDFALWQPVSGNWLIKGSRDGARWTRNWGLGIAPYYDLPVPGDYDGDGKLDVAVFRRLDGRWYIQRSTDGGVTVQAWGISSDVPVPADYDGDGQTDIAVWRGAEGGWYILHSADQRHQIIAWGASGAGDVPVPGDYDGDGKTDWAVWRNSEGRFYLRHSAADVIRLSQHGQSGDTPILLAPKR